MPRVCSSARNRFRTFKPLSSGNITSRRTTRGSNCRASSMADRPPSASSHAKPSISRRSRTLSRVSASSSTISTSIDAVALLMIEPLFDELAHATLGIEGAEIRRRHYQGDSSRFSTGVSDRHCSSYIGEIGAVKHVSGIVRVADRTRLVWSVKFRPEASNCIHAVSDIDSDGGFLHVGKIWGEAASARVVEHLRRWMIEPEKTHPWIANRLGLENYVRSQQPQEPRTED